MSSRRDLQRKRKLARRIRVRHYPQFWFRGWLFQEMDRILQRELQRHRRYIMAGFQGRELILNDVGDFARTDSNPTTAAWGIRLSGRGSGKTNFARDIARTMALYGGGVAEVTITRDEPTPPTQAELDAFTEQLLDSASAQLAIPRSMLLGRAPGGFHSD